MAVYNEGAIVIVGRMANILMDIYGEQRTERHSPFCKRNERGRAMKVARFERLVALLGAMFFFSGGAVGSSDEFGGDLLMVKSMWRVEEMRCFLLWSADTGTVCCVLYAIKAYF